MASEFTLPCSHCGNKTVLEVKATVTNEEEVELWDGETHNFERYFYLVQCKTCGEVSLYADWEGDEQPGNLKSATRLYPSPRRFRGLPQAIAESYREAKRVEKHSPTAFAVLLRRSLEYLCKDKGAEGRTLKEQLSDLASKGVIPTTLARMAGTLRYFGNMGAHSTEVKIGPSEAKVMDDFFTAMVEYVYIAPAKLEEVEKKLKNGL